MKIQVSHKQHDRYYDFSAKAVDVAKGSFTKVAIVTTNETDVFKALENAYYHTNNIDSVWAEDADWKDGIEALVEQARSSSVGDVFTVDNVDYIVAPCGFEKII